MNNEKVNKAAKIIAKSKRVLFLTSAGMSADSNIPTFRDKEGYWRNFPPFREKKLDAQDLASPWAFRNELPHAWAFYEWRRRNAKENNPHDGYFILNKWMAEGFEESFIHTTNTDGFHIRSGTPIDQIKEVHGSMWRLQCLEVCSQRYWENDSVPLCVLNYDTMKASNFPQCPYCRGIARPHILMFGDGEYTGHPDQEANFSEFTRKPIDTAILVGSSGAVPTNDYIAYGLKQRGTKLININPDPSSCQLVQPDYYLPLKSREAFVALDNKLGI